MDPMRDFHASQRAARASLNQPTARSGCLPPPAYGGGEGTRIELCADSSFGKVPKQLLAQNSYTGKRNIYGEVLILKITATLPPIDVSG